jgi:hypothetical protein
MKAENSSSNTVTISPLTEEQIQRIAKWRGWTPEFCREMSDQGVFGIIDGNKLAFPVKGGAHVMRSKNDPKGRWRYTEGAKTEPLVIGDQFNGTLSLHESTWDALSWLATTDGPALATRGASNARQAVEYLKLHNVRSAVAVPQNDAAGQQWLKDLIAGLNGSCDLTVLEVPEQHKDFSDWRNAGATDAEVSEALTAAKPVKAVDATADKPNHERPTRKRVIGDLSSVVALPVDWIEQPYVARGEFHLLQGRGGSYKGTLTLTWAAEFSRRGEPVLLLSAEDDPAKKIKPLLMAAGANIDLVKTLEMTEDELEEALILPLDLKEFEEAIAEVGARLVIIDPITSHVSRTANTRQDQDMKRILTKLVKLAQRTGVVIVGVHHFKKDVSGGMKTAPMDSGAFGTTPRVLLTMHKLSEEQIVLEVTKSNIGPEGDNQLLQAEIVDVAPGIRMPRLTRAGKSPVGVEEAMTLEHKTKETKAEQSAILILDILEDEGEQKQSELFARVASETDSTSKSVKRKAYFDILKKQELVDSRSSNFRGEWIVSRTDKERPRRLRRTAAGGES